MNSRYPLIFLLLILAGLLQNTDVLNFYQIKPNLVLVFLIAISFFIPNFLTYLGLVLVGLILIAFRPGFEPEAAVLGLLAVLSFSLVRFLNLQMVYNNFLLIGASTLLFYLLTAPSFILQNPLLVFGEMVYNLVLGVIFFRIFETWLKTNSILKT